MKNKTQYSFLLVLLLLQYVGAKGQNTFSKIFPVDTDGQPGMSATLLEDGYLVTANIQYNINSALYKTDFQGNLIWKKKFIYNLSCSHPELTKIKKSKIYIAGAKQDSIGAGTSLTCLNLNGSILWSKFYRKPNFEEYAQTMVDNGDHFVISSVRIRTDTTPQSSELFVYKVDTLGNILKEATVVRLARGYKYWTSSRFRNNKYYLSYAYNYFRGNSFQDAATVILDSSLTIINSTIYLNRGDSEEGIAQYIPLRNNKKLFIWHKDTIKTSPPPFRVTGWSNSVMYFLDSNNVEEKRIALFDSCLKYVNNVKELANGDILGVGERWYSSFEPNVVAKGWVFRMTSLGEIKWERFFLDSLYGYEPSLLDFEEDKQGNLIISGGIYRNRSSDRSVWLMKLDSNGCLRPGCTDANIEVATKEAQQVEYLKVSPNPVQNDGKIDLPASMYALDKKTIKISDVIGRLFSPPMQQNGAQLEVQTNALPSGIYFVELLDKENKRYLAKFVVSH